MRNPGRDEGRKTVRAAERLLRCSIPDFLSSRLPHPAFGPSRRAIVLCVLCDSVVKELPFIPPPSSSAGRRPSPCTCASWCLAGRRAPCHCRPGHASRHRGTASPSAPARRRRRSIRSSGRSPAWAAGEPGSTSSMYGGVASTGFATSLIPVKPAYSSFYALS